LKHEEGRAVLQRLVSELPVDVFCTNTMPSRHATLGIDAATLRTAREDLIWCGISAMGMAYPDVPGYDPAMQALCGYMDLTGEPDGPPLQCGPPLIDLKAGDEVFAQVILALLEREQSGSGKMIDISMAHAATSWLSTFLPMLDMGSPPEEIRRHGNEHRQFIPVNAYATADGNVFLAVGSDAQWERLIGLDMFATLAEERYRTNEGRRAHKDELHRVIGAIMAQHTSGAVTSELVAATIPHAPITPIEQVADLPFVRETALSTETPDGDTVRLPPPAVPTPFLNECGRRQPFAPAYGEDTDAVLVQVGYTSTEVADLRDDAVIY
jgi:crotonobetainyl-CoA:carnitine CoA-transferase CaiB-like acyl-CoA transferase